LARSFQADPEPAPAEAFLVIMTMSTPVELIRPIFIKVFCRSPEVESVALETNAIAAAKPSTTSG